MTRELREVDGQDFIDRIDSLVVGPRARITFCDDPTGSGDRVTFGPGEKTPELGKRSVAPIRSIRMQCG